MPEEKQIPASKSDPSSPPPPMSDAEWWENLKEESRRRNSGPWRKTLRVIRSTWFRLAPEILGGRTLVR